MGEWEAVCAEVSPKGGIPRVYNRWYIPRWYIPRWYNRRYIPGWCIA